MVTPGIQDDDGTFQRPTLDEIEQRIHDKAREELDENVDLSQGSPIKQLLDIVILESDHLWELLEETYYAAYYGHTYEEQLDKLLELAQIKRIPRRGATGEVTFTTEVANVHDVIIPEGTRVSSHQTEDRPPIPFITTETKRLEAGHNSVNVPIRAAEPWETDVDERWLGEETNVAAGTIRNIETAIAGVDRVSNQHPTGEASRRYGFSFIEGRDREADHEFRERFESMMGSEGAASLDAIKTAVKGVGGVRSVHVDENYSMEEDENGLPPKSFRVIVHGDAPNDEIAQTIISKRSAGIEDFGEDSGEATTKDGVTREVNFDWAGEVGIHVEVEVTHDDRFPSDGNKRVEDNIIKYIGGETVDGDEYDGTDMGRDVIYDMVFKQAMKVRGVFRVELYIGDDEENLGTDDVVIPDKHTAITTPEDVIVFNSMKDKP